MANKNYYEILGVDKNASEQEIKTAFRKLSRKYHPDMQSGKTDTEKKQAEDKFKELAEAYDVLSNPDKRQNYDNFGESGNFEFSGMHDFMARHAGMFSSMFSDFGFNPFGRQFNKSRSQSFNPNQPESGNDIFKQIMISFKESIFGCEKEITVPYSIPCSDCNGTGFDKNVKPEQCSYCSGTGVKVQQIKMPFGVSITQSECPHCNGTGINAKKCSSCNGTKRKTTDKKLVVKIPAGIESGQNIRIVDKGECGVCGGKNGTLYINVIVSKSELFERNNLDLITTIYISPITAMLGGKVEVPTITGYKHITVNAGVQNDTVFKIKGAGIKTKNNTGDLHIVIKIETLMNLTDEQKQLLKTFDKTVVHTNINKINLQKEVAKKFLNEK